MCRVAGFLPVSHGLLRYLESRLNFYLMSWFLDFYFVEMVIVGKTSFNPSLSLLLKEVNEPLI